MRKFKGSAFLILIFLGIIGLLASCNNDSGDKKGEKVSFYYAAAGSDYEGSLYYTDDFFKSPATTYNPSLSTLSLGLAMSAFMSLNSPLNDYSYRYKNCESLLLSTGFKNIFVNDDYKKKPTTDSLGVVIGSKKIDEYTLLAVGIRGQGYQQEWASNCKVGNGINEKRHEGFNDGAMICLKAINDYINKYSIEGKIKIWSAGYSRASAVNNLAIATIDKALVTNEEVLPKTVTVTKDDLYAYCFEVPMGASFEEDISPRSDIYNNIHNIINIYDPVPMVPMEGLGFTRYGIDHYLANPTNDDDYQKDLDVIKKYYNSITASSAVGEYKVDSFVYYGGLGEKKTNYFGEENTVNFHSGLFFRDLLEKMVEEGATNREIFKTTIEDGLRQVFTMLFKGDTISDSLSPFAISFVMALLTKGNMNYFIEEIMHNPEIFVNDVMVVIKAAVSSSELLEDVSPIEFCEQIRGIISLLTNVFNKHLYTLFPFLSVNNLKILAQAHQPIVCMANLMSMDPNYNSKPITCNSDGGYYILEIPYVSEHGYIVIKMDGKLIAEITEGSTRKLSMYTYGVLDGKFIAHLPLGHKYEVESTIGSYSLKEYNQKYQNKLDVDVELEKDPYVDDIKIRF